MASTAFHEPKIDRIEALGGYPAPLDLSAEGDGDGDDDGDDGAGS